MPRAKRGFKARRRRNRIMKAAKGFRGKRSSCHAAANEAVQHAWMHMYKSRKQKKRDFRSLWITRINAAARTVGVSYSKLIGQLHKAGIDINRKMLAEIAISDPVAFAAIAKGLGSHLPREVCSEACGPTGSHVFVFGPRPRPRPAASGVARSRLARPPRPSPRAT
jgi:large subunit ribosomal protein L20